MAYHHYTESHTQAFVLRKNSHYLPICNAVYTTVLRNEGGQLKRYTVTVSHRNFSPLAMRMNRTVYQLAAEYAILSNNSYTFHAAESMSGVENKFQRAEIAHEKR